MNPGIRHAAVDAAPANQPSFQFPEWLPSLAGLRTLAAAAVFFTHATAHANFFTGEVREVLTRIFYLPGAIGVGLFFILSGFIMTWVTRPGDSKALFIRRRLVRIYPNHLFTFALAGVLLVTAAHRAPDASWLANLLLVQSWVPSVAVGNSVNAVSWSLSCEMFFYLAFPLMFPAINRIRPERLWWSVAGVLLVMATVSIVGLWWIGGVPYATPLGEDVSFEQQWFVYRFPPVRALDFVLGMLLARIVVLGRWPALNVPAAIAIAIAGHVAFRFVPPLIAKGGLGSAWTFPLIASAAVADCRGQTSALRHRAMVWLGQRSFAFYMVHAIAISVTVAIAGRTKVFSLPVGILVMLGALAFSLLLSLSLYRWVEEPCARRLRNPGRRRVLERQRWLS